MVVDINFNNLPSYTSPEAADQIAVVRGVDTGRIVISELLSQASLPPGNDVLRSLYWNTVTEMWEAVSDESRIYYALTRANTFGGADGLMTAIRYALDNVGNSFAVSGQNFAVKYPYYNNAFKLSDIEAAWPQGSDAPYFWCVVPSRWGQVDDFTYLDTMPVIIRGFMRIGGIPYDIAVVRLQGAEPPTGPIGWAYTSPSLTTLTIEEGV